MMSQRCQNRSQHRSNRHHLIGAGEHRGQHYEPGSAALKFIASSNLVGFCTPGQRACSRVTSSAFLSVRSPRKAGCRISPSRVHSVNFTSPTSLGISHVVSFSYFTFWSKGFLLVRKDCIFPQSDFSIASLKPVPTCPA